MAVDVSKIYGEALFQCAKEEKQLSKVQKEAEKIIEFLSEKEELGRFLSHPQIEKREKRKMTDHLFKGRCSDIITGFLHLVIEKGREKELPGMLDFFIQRAKEEKRIGTVYVTSAIALSGALRKELEEKLLDVTPFQSLEVSYQVNKNLIGGLLIRINDKVLDSTLRTKLEDIKKEGKRGEAG